MKVKIFLVVLVLFSQALMAQEIGLNEWRYHIPFQKGIAVADVGDNVYCASELGMYYYSKEDNSVNRFSRVQGLSDIGISDLAYSDRHGALVVGYTNGNIDLVFGNQVTNMADIKRTNIPGSKRINRISIIDHLVYLSCGFGIVLVDIEKREISATYTLNINGNLGVNDITVNQGYIYAATDKGMYFAPENSVNLSDPNAWIAENSLPDSTFSRTFVLNNKVYANYDNKLFNSDTLYFQNNGAWQKVPQLYGLANNFFDTNGNSALVCHNDKVIVYDELWNIIQSLSTYGQVAPQAQQGVFDREKPSTIWLADQRKGLVEVLGENQYESHTVFGPITNKSHQITSNRYDVWVAAGSVVGYGWRNTYNKDGVYKFSDDEWTTYNKSTLFGIDSLFDFLSVAINPVDQDQVFFAAHGDGIMEMKSEVHTQTYGQSNSSIELFVAATPTYQYAGMTSLAFDANNILWGANSGSSRLLCAKDQEDNWYSFDLSSVIDSRGTGRMITTTDNKIWVTFPQNGGIAVFDYNNTIGDTLDDKRVGLTKSSGGLSSNYVLDVVEDLNGEMWVATAEGIVVYRNPSDLFSDSPTPAEKPLIQEDGYTEYLLESQVVTAIAIDGANRKWFGTSSSGVYLIAEDGTEEILHFTVENSPLMSNGIITIGVNHETGEVFFGTEQGICSYKSTATEGKADYSAVYAYPNPVEPNYYGDIAITGLVANSEIRITDISGNLVYQGIADGGQAVWNGNTAEGNRIKTGVYLVFCAAPDGTQSVATKILFIN